MLPGRGLSAAVIAVALGGTLACPVAGHTETIELQLKLEPGETLYYTYSSSLSVQMSEPQRATTTNEEGRLTLRVLNVDLGGIMSVESVIEDLRTTTDGRTRDELRAPVVLKIRPDGTLVEEQGGAEPPNLPAWSSAFPGHPVSVGESWTTHVRVPLPVFAVELNPTFTLTGVDQTAEGHAAHIRSRADGPLKNPDFPSSGGMHFQASGAVHESGEDVWSVERGRLLRSESEGTADIRVLITVSGHTVLSSGTSRFHVRVEALPPDKVAAPSVSADALIVPGAAIGPFAIERGMNDLVNRLGTARNGASVRDQTMWGVDRGFRSAEGTWSNGLVAYVDWDDASKLLGLGVADRRFRTDKGIGFGSSPGAVLFAYGMSPVRLDMKSSRALPGAVWVLIYDNQGIAFAIAANDSREIRRPRTPAGTVAWIVIFPPGGAGRIFPLP